MTAKQRIVCGNRMGFGLSAVSFGVTVRRTPPVEEVGRAILKLIEQETFWDADFVLQAAGAC